MKPNPPPKLGHAITPHLWFATQVVEASKYRVSVFPKSKLKKFTTIRDTPSDDCEVVAFDLAGQPFMAISAGPLFKFNKAIPFIIRRDTQEEVDYYWEKLSADPKAEQCGWCKERFGVSWQVTPALMDKKMAKGTKDQISRVSRAFLSMKKFDIVALKRAYADG